MNVPHYFCSAKIINAEKENAIFLIILKTFVKCYNYRLKPSYCLLFLAATKKSNKIAENTVYIFLAV